MVDKSILLDNKKFTLGIFDDPDKLLHAVETLKQKGVKIFDCYTPFPVHHLDKALGYKRTNLTVGAFLCGFLGALSGFTLAYSMNVVDWPMIIGGKPTSINMFTSFIPVIFELTILFTAFGMVILFFIRSRMLHGIKEDLLDERQTNDHLLLAIDNEEDQDLSNADIVSLLKSEGAIDVKGETEAFNTSHTMDNGGNSSNSKSVPKETKNVKVATSKKVTLSDTEKESRIQLIKSAIGEGSEDTKDDLKLISGVGPKYEQTLNSIGIYTFEQVSKMTPEAIKAVEEVTNYFPGRIERDDWIGQAKKLMK